MSTGRQPGGETVIKTKGGTGWFEHHLSASLSPASLAGGVPQIRSPVPTDRKPVKHRNRTHGGAQNEKDLLDQGAATLATIAGLALTARSAQAATTPCDPLGDVFCPGTGGAVQLTFTPGTTGAGQITALATGVAAPADPYIPPNPATAYAQGKLYQGAPGDPYSPGDPYLIGRVYAPTADRPTWLFDGHLVPATDAGFPTDPTRFVGVLLPPSPI